MDHTELKVGDEIIMVEGAPYSITAVGSIGIICAIHDNHASVKYSKLTGESWSAQNEFIVLLKYCKKLQEFHGPSLPPVLLKIREMYARQQLAVL
jgi:hypothetical protein